MRIVINMIVLLCFVLVMQSCKQSAEVSEKVSNVAQQKLDTMDKAKVLAHKTDIENLRQAVNNFYGAEGRYPKDLSELEQFASVVIDKGIYKYDPKTGALALMQ
ncbi:MAG: hypothetical protein HQK99_03645 [Nitrospirae bacterium]|nr:hypothetical protein [Nitrospirota bacterium]